MFTGTVSVIRQVIRELRHIAMAQTPAHRHLRERMLVLLGATVVVWIVASFAVFGLERHAAGTEISNLGDSFFWVGAQLTTVSSQMPNPLTDWGRILDLVLELWSITVVATLAGALGAFFIRRSHERDPLTPPASSPRPGADPPRR